MNLKEELKEYILNHTVEMVDLLSSIDQYGNYQYIKNDKEHMNECVSNVYDFVSSIYYSKGGYDINDDYFYEDECGLIRSCDTETIADIIKDDIDTVMMEIINFYKLYPEEIHNEELKKILSKL